MNSVKYPVNTFAKIIHYDNNNCKRNQNPFNQQKSFLDNKTVEFGQTTSP